MIIFQPDIALKPSEGTVRTIRPAAYQCNFSLVSDMTTQIPVWVAWNGGDEDNSFLQPQLNLVLYVAAPVNCLDFFGLGGDSCWSSLSVSR